MDEKRLWALFFEVYEALPRQGPGNKASALRALALCPQLPALPRVLDLGCGVGGQTFYLSRLTNGHITAIDQHAPSIERLVMSVQAHGLASRIDAQIGDMSALPDALGTFDLIWSEGALYNMGIANALALCRERLNETGYLVFSDAVWRKANPPAAIKAGFDQDYPAMGTVDDTLATIDASGFQLIDHFTLPDEAWWDDFYTPMLKQIDTLRLKYRDDHEAQEILDQLAQEPELHRQYSEYYAYEFFVLQKRI